MTIKQNNFAELQKYIGNLIFKLPIYTEVKISGNNFQALIIFSPEIEKSLFIEVKHNLCEYIFGATLFPEYTSIKRVDCGNLSVIHLVKSYSKTLNGVKKRLKLPMILVTT